MKARDVIRAIEADGWVLKRVKGSHRQYSHPTKPGLVTIPYHGGNAELMPPLLTSIGRQAGINLGKQ